MSERNDFEETNRVLELLRAQLEETDNGQPQASADAPADEPEEAHAPAELTEQPTAEPETAPVEPETAEEKCEAAAEKSEAAAEKPEGASEKAEGASDKPERSYDNRYGQIHYFDGLRSGDVVSLRYRAKNADQDATVAVFAADFNEAAFREVRGQLSEQVFSVEERSDTELIGTVLCQKESVFFTTIIFTPFASSSPRRTFVSLAVIFTMSTSSASATPSTCFAT